MPYILTRKLRELEPYQPISGEYEVRLDANESFLPMPQDELAKACSTIESNRYPDAYAGEVIEKFAQLFELDPACITAGNGSDELISILCACFLESGDSILTFAPDFSMYAFYGSLYEVNVHVMEKDADLQIDVDAVVSYVKRNAIKAVLFSNPCNPTSLGLTRDKVLRMLEALQEENALMILDEAYMDFWDQSLLDCISEYDNLIILKTCSKAIGLAAVRLGFAVTNPTLTTALRAAKSPYNVNAVTQAIGASALSDTSNIRNRIDRIIASRDALYKAISPLCEKSSIIERLYDTVTNFVFIKTPKAKEIWQALLDRSIAVRCMGDYLRITCGTEEENDRLLTSFEAVIKDMEG